MRLASIGYITITSYETNFETNLYFDKPMITFAYANTDKCLSNTCLFQKGWCLKIYSLLQKKKLVQSKFWQEPMFLHVLAKLSKIIDPMFMAFKRRKHGNNLLIKSAFDVGYLFYTSKIQSKITT